MSYLTDTTLSQPMALKQVLLIRNDNDNVFILSIDFETLGRRLLTAYPVCVSTKCYVLFGQIGVHRVTKTLTGVRSSGVEMGELSLLSLIPLPRSKSQIFTGEICKKQVSRKSFLLRNDYPQLTGMTMRLQSACGNLKSSDQTF